MRDHSSVQQHADELAALYEVTQELSRQTLNQEQILRLVAERAAQFAQVDSAGLFFYDTESQTLIGQVGYGPGENIVAGMRLPVSADRGVHEAVRARRPVVIEDVAHTDHVRPDMSGRLGVRSRLCVPILLRGSPIGLLLLDDIQHTRPFTPQQVRLAIGLAAQAAIAIENARLFEAEQRRASELSEALAKQQEFDQLQSEFIQNVSHELRTPLTLIRGYAEMLNSGALGGLAEQQTKPVAIITDRARSLGDLVEDITAILELETRSIQVLPVDLAQVTQQALTDFQTWADQKRITLRGEVPSSLPTAMGEARQLRKVVDNLISNALKFTPDGGTITVHLAEHNGWLKLEVTDTGIGIPPDKLDRVFERFYQVDGSIRRKYGGTGLGLALVKEIIEAHRGQVKAESEPDRGSTFTVWLPSGEHR